MKIKRFLILICIMLAISLTSCGNSSGGGAPSGGAPSSPAATSKNGGTLSEVLEGQKIWFLVDDWNWSMDKESDAKALVFENGMVYSTGWGDHTIGEYARMSDEEIIDFVKTKISYDTGADELIEIVENNEIFNGGKTFTGKVKLFNFLTYEPEKDSELVKWAVDRFLSGAYSGFDESYIDYISEMDEQTLFDWFYYDEGEFLSNEYIECKMTLDYSEIKDTIIESLNNEEITYDIGVFTDGSGNRVEKEQIRMINKTSPYRSVIESLANLDDSNFIEFKYPDAEIIFNDGTITKTIKPNTSPEAANMDVQISKIPMILNSLDGDEGTRTVYESIYQGYWCIDGSDNYAFVTRVDDGKLMFMLDDMKSKNVEIDPRDW